MKKIIFPFIFLFILCIILIYTQMDRANATMGESIQSSELLDDISVEWNIKNDKIQIQLLDKHNNPITKLEKIDRDKLKIVVINQDFTFFEHIPCDYEGDGIFEVNVNLNKKEAYTFFLFLEDDFKSYQLSDFQMDNWEKSTIPKDVLLNKKIDDLNAVLQFPPLFVNEKSGLTFQLNGDSKKNKFNPLREQKGVLFVIDEEASSMELVYPSIQEKDKITFEVVFTKSGIYKLWGEFQWNGKKIVFPYVVQVQKRE